MAVFFCFIYTNVGHARHEKSVKEMESVENEMGLI